MAAYLILRLSVWCFICSGWLALVARAVWSGACRATAPSRSSTLAAPPLRTATTAVSSARATTARLRCGTHMQLLDTSCLTATILQLACVRLLATCMRVRVRKHLADSVMGSSAAAYRVHWWLRSCRSGMVCSLHLVCDAARLIHASPHQLTQLLPALPCPVLAVLPAATINPQPWPGDPGPWVELCVRPVELRLHPGGAGGGRRAVPDAREPGAPGHDAAGGCGLCWQQSVGSMARLGRRT